MMLNNQQFRACSLNHKQLKAAKRAYNAMRKAGELGVHFWDNYGTLECYNSLGIDKPAPDPSLPYDLSENPVTYSEYLKNFHYGNADDPLKFQTKSDENKS